jgi:ERCC4-type nuclease
MVTLLEVGDVMCACDDGTSILIERKSPDDFLNSLKDDRLFLQLSNMLIETRWSYLIVTDPFTRGQQNQVVTARGVTGWAWAALQGALTTIQELGVFVVYSAGEEGFEDTVLSIGRRSHDKTVKIPPAKMPQILSVQEAILASLPGIGFERASAVLDLSDGSPAWAICALTDATTHIPGIGDGIKRRVRAALKLADDAQLCVVMDGDREMLVQAKLGSQ